MHGQGFAGMQLSKGFADFLSQIWLRLFATYTLQLLAQIVGCVGVFIFQHPQYVPINL